MSSTSPPIFAPGQRVTCIGYTATGQQCRRAVARGPTAGYCHLHVHQGITFADSLAGTGTGDVDGAKVHLVSTAGRGHRQRWADDSDSEEPDGKAAVAPPRGYSKAYLPKNHSNSTNDEENEPIVVSSSDDDDEFAELAIRVRKLAISDIQTPRKSKSRARTQRANQPHQFARPVVPSPLSGIGAPSRKRMPHVGLNQPAVVIAAPTTCKPRSTTVSSSPTPRKDSLIRRTKTADPLGPKPFPTSTPRVPSTARAGLYVVAPARTASASASISLPSGSYQCTARTRRTGERCTRIVRRDGVDTSGSWDSGKGVLCHQHRAEQLDEALNEEELAVDPEAPRVMGDPGGDAEAFLASFGASLPAPTAHLVRTELLRPVSAADEAGYLYAYRIHSESPTTTTASSSSPPTSTSPTHLTKIGRSLHPHRRLTQWSHHCNHPLTLIAVFPHSPGQLTVPHPRLQCRLAHRAERLVHVHLGGTHPVGAAASGSGWGGVPCGGCGEVHREWFEGEWDEVRWVVEAWVRFVGVVRMEGGATPGTVPGDGHDGRAPLDLKPMSGPDLLVDCKSIEGSAPAVGTHSDLKPMNGSRPAPPPPTDGHLNHTSIDGQPLAVPTPPTDLKPIEGPPSETRTPLPPPRKRKYHVSVKRKPDPAVESDEDEAWLTANED